MITASRGWVGTLLLGLGLAAMPLTTVMAQTPATVTPAHGAPSAAPLEPSTATVPSTSKSTETPAPPATPPAFGVMHAYDGLLVRRVELRGAPASLAQAGQVLDLQVGEPLTQAKVSQSVAALDASGRFANIVVEAAREGSDGVVVSFVVTPNYFVDSVRLADPAPKRPSSAQLLNATKLDLGELFSEDKLARAEKRIRTALEEEGYLNPDVKVEKIFHAENQQVGIIFHIISGTGSRLGQLQFAGDEKTPVADLLEQARMHTGDEISAQRVSDGLKRLRKFYQKQDFLLAQVSITQRTPHLDRNTVDFSFHLVPGPKVGILVEGVRLSTRVIKQLIPVYEENAVDDDLINEGARNLGDYLQTQGFFDVKVQSARQTNDKTGRLDVVYTVDRGRRHRVAQVLLQGNQYFEDSLLRERMQVQPAGAVVAAQKLAQGLFSQSLMNRDKTTIEDLYRANGFADVKISTMVDGKFGGDPDAIGVTFHVDEGKQTRVTALIMTGNQSLPLQDLRDVLGDTEGQPFSEANVESDRQAVLNAYFVRGFPDATFEAAVTPSGTDPTRVQLTYKIVEGRQSSIHNVFLSGLNYTRPFVVNRALKLQSGDPLNQVSLLEVQRRLYDLGLFSEVNVAIQNPNGDEREKNIVVGLTEAQRWTFNYGFGIEFQTGQPTGSSPNGATGVSPRVSLDITRINLFGREQTLLFRSRLGRLEQRGLLSWDAPHLFLHPALRLTATLLYDNSLDVNTFTSQRLEGSLQAEQALGRFTTLLYRYTYRRVRATNFASNFNPEAAPLLSQPVRVGLPSFTYIRDRRDNPIETHRGSYNTLDLGLAAGFFGSEANFSRVLAQNSTYHLLKKRYVLARSTRVGVESVFGTTTFVPLPERFFAGGVTTLRGFSFNQAGPRDPVSGLPVGGNAIFINNLELRLPPVPLRIFSGGLSFVLFHDAGNVFDTGNHLLSGVTRFTQDKSNCGALVTATACNLNYLSQAVGTGIRYKTPIGPVSVDFGYNLNPPVYPVRDPVNPRVDTGRRFNIFFSIGQTF